MRLKKLQDSIILIYTSDKAECKQLIQLMLKMGVECKCEENIDAISEHIVTYKPSLIFAPKRCASDYTCILGDNVTFLTTKQALYRELSLILFNLSNEQWGALLREAPMEYLTKFIWYICDADLLKQILSHLSLRAAQYIIEELEKNYACTPHADASPELLQEAESMSIEMLQLCYQIRQLDTEEL